MSLSTLLNSIADRVVVRYARLKNSVFEAWQLLYSAPLAVLSLSVKNMIAKFAENILIYI